MADVSGDVTMDFWVENQVGDKITSGRDIIFVGNFEEKTENVNLYIPSNAPEGSYKLVTKLLFDTYEITSHRDLEIKEYPLVLEIDVEGLERISTNSLWQFETKIDSNKEKTLPGNLKWEIKKGLKKEWLKESDVLFNSSLSIINSVRGLEQGNYILKIDGEIGGENLEYKESFVVGSFIQKPFSIYLIFLAVVVFLFLGIIFITSFYKKKIRIKSRIKLRKKQRKRKERKIKKKFNEKWLITVSIMFSFSLLILFIINHWTNHLNHFFKQTYGITYLIVGISFVIGLTILAFINFLTKIRKKNKKNKKLKRKK